MDWLNKYLLATAAFHLPPGEGDGPGEGEDQYVEDQDFEGAEEPDESLEAGEQDAGVQDGEEAEDEEEPVDAQPARKPNRAQSRIQSLTQTVAQEKAERQRIERELQELRAEQRARAQQSQQESPEARAARRALMSESELMREDLKESEARTQALLQRQLVESRETNDRLTYQAVLRDAPHLKKYDEEVEKVRLENQQNGSFVPREVILDYVIGRAARARAVKDAPKARKEGQRRIAAQQVKPARAGGDTATQRGRQGDSVEKRLENVPI